MSEGRYFIKIIGPMQGNRFYEEQSFAIMALRRAEDPHGRMLCQGKQATTSHRAFHQHVRALTTPMRSLAGPEFTPQEVTERLGRASKRSNSVSNGNSQLTRSAPRAVRLATSGGAPWPTLPVATNLDVLDEHWLGLMLRT